MYLYTDYPGTESSNRGQKEYRSGDYIINMTEYRLSMDPNATIFNTSDTGGTSDKCNVQEEFKCEDKDCIIECNERASCLLANIILEYNNSGSIANAEPRIAISCQDQISCLRSSITTRTTSSTTDIILECNGDESCASVSIDLDQFRSFNILCQEMDSCKDVTINIEIPDSILNMTTNNTTMNKTHNHGIVHCIVPGACNGLYINTNSNHTQLIMYEYSERVTLDNGIGYLSDLDNIICNNDRYIKYKTWSTENQSTISKSIQNEYISDQYPCADVEVKCNLSSCAMTYDMNTNEINSLSSELEGDCHWINVQQVQNVVCNGQCASSPTQAPTYSPTESPTQPSESPTVDPTIKPTINPSTNPTMNPTFEPTHDPT